MAQEIPVYVFTGFMDSGKTSLVEETLFENEFGDGAKGIIIMCEGKVTGCIDISEATQENIMDKATRNID